MCTRPFLLPPQTGLGTRLNNTQQSLVTPLHYSTFLLCYPTLLPSYISVPYVAMLACYIHAIIILVASCVHVHNQVVCQVVFETAARDHVWPHHEFIMYSSYPCVRLV